MNLTEGEIENTCLNKKKKNTATVTPKQGLSFGMLKKISITNKD